MLHRRYEGKRYRPEIAKERTRSRRSKRGEEHVLLLKEKVVSAAECAEVWRTVGADMSEAEGTVVRRRRCAGLRRIHGEDVIELVAGNRQVNLGRSKGSELARYQSVASTMGEIRGRGGRVLGMIQSSTVVKVAVGAGARS